MTISQTFLQLFTFVYAASLLPIESASLIPSTFPDQDPESYTVLYLSQSEGLDEEACLRDQGFLAPLNNISACKSLGFVLTNKTRQGDKLIFFLKMVIVLIAPGEYDYAGGIEVHNSSSIILAKDPRLEGEVLFRCSDLIDNRKNNLFFKYVDHVSFMGVTAIRCGLVRSNFALEHCTNIFLSNCTFRDNYSGAVILHRCTQILVENTVFVNNSGSSPYISVPQLDISNTDDGFRLAGGLTISYRKSSIPSFAQVKNCTFRGNTANINESNEEDASKRPFFYNPRGHGGGLLVAFENSSNHSVAITNCLFEKNSAQVGGGGVYILFYRGSSNDSRFGASSSRNNSVSVVDSNFRRNDAGLGGGAIHGLAIEEAIENEIIIQNCLIMNNSAGRGGGGLTFILQVAITLFESFVVPVRILVNRTVFEGNSCLSGKGGAITLLAFINVIQIIEPIRISQCNFSRNHGKDGAVYSYRYPISLEGQNRWSNNSNSVLFLIDSRITLEGENLFVDNTGENGGAVQMTGNSNIKIFENSNSTYLRNTAVLGGAMYISTQSLVIDTNIREALYSNCFIRYYDSSPPSNWKAKISFLDNTVNDTGAAIYYTDVFLCRYDALEVEPQGIEGTLFDLHSIFTYRNNGVIENGVREEDDIASDAFVLETLQESYSLFGAPGQKLSFYIQCVDETGNDQPCIYSSNIREGLFFLPRVGKFQDHVVQQLDEPSLIERYYNQCLSDPEYYVKSYSIQFSVIELTTGESLNTTQINVTITCCRPGFELKNGTCVYKKGNAVILRGDHDKKFLYLKPRQYAKVRNGTIITAAMPIFYRNCIQQGNLTGCLFEQEQPENQCRDGRTGFLCGVCPEGTSNDLSLSQCITCHGWHVVFIVALVLFVIIVSSLIMLYNFELTSEIKGFIFYIQVIGFIYEFGEFTGGSVTWDFHLVNILGYNLYLPLCPYPGYDALYTVALGFILPFAAIFTIAIYILGAKCIKKLSNKTSFDGIWFLTFFIYKLIADLSFKILLCSKVTNGDKNEYVFSYDGNVKCFSTDHPAHLVLSVGALLLSVAVFAFTIFILIISFKRFQLTQNFTDVITKGLNPSHRWWSSFDLFRRIFIIYVLLILNYLSPQYSQLALLSCSLIIFIIFALATPYTSKKAIYMETAMLLDLIIITGVSLNTNYRTRQKLRVFSLILLFLPYVIMFGYIATKAIVFLCGYIKCPSKVQFLFAELQGKLLRRSESSNEVVDADDTSFATDLNFINDSTLHIDDYQVVISEPSDTRQSFSFTKDREPLLALDDNPI